MKPFGPFDAVGAIALEIERMSGFAQGQADFSLGTVEDVTSGDLTPKVVEKMTSWRDYKIFFAGFMWAWFVDLVHTGFQWFHVIPLPAVCGH